MTSANRGTVLITGGNGYLALWAIQKHLEHGYRVRASVRSIYKGDILRAQFREFGDHFEFVVVEDMTKKGAFDDAVRGVDAIQHMASPTDTPTDDPDVYMKPAVDGTLGLLESAMKHGSDIKRIVYTSSTGAVFTPGGPPKAYNESDWNDLSVEIVNKNGRNSERHMMYLASKVLAERAAWSFWEKNKNSVKWDLSSVCAPWLLGPAITTVSSPDKLNGSLRIFYEMCVAHNDIPKTKDELADTNLWIDVRDLAEQYVGLLESDNVGGERYIIAKESSSWQDWIDAINRVSNHGFPTSRPFPKGYPGLDKIPTSRYDLSKANAALSPKLRDMDETARDMLVQWSACGFLD